MNGGVSLAVWMAGMTHELDLLRRATTPRSPSSGPYDEPVAQRWRELLAARDGRPRRRVVIDVVACVDTLARAVRASASFPVAFAPVYEVGLLNRVGQSRERPRQHDTQPSWLMDGAVLHNVPFGPVLEQVAGPR